MFKISKYNKLVRDKIPDIIESTGKKPVVKVLQNSESSLREKLIEEVNEFLASGEIEELADILEVVFALSEEACHASKEELLNIYQKKHDARGGFSKKIFLLDVKE